MSDLFEELGEIHPEDDIAFAELVRRYQSDLNDKLSNLDDRDDSSYYHLTFINRVIAAATELNIEPFASWDIPPRSRIFDNLDKFNLALERFVTGLQIRKSRGAKIYSVSLDDNDKRRIHFFVGRIREVVEKADLEESKKNSLFKKLHAFARDVDMARTPFGNAMLMGIDIANLAKQFGEAIKPATEFVQSINELLGAAKDSEPEQQQLPPAEERKRVEAPPKRIEPPRLSRDLDDDIPF